jgi:phosphoribosylformimino-5-aminoimidazole carboxamide ribotide isomerase
VRLRRGDMDDDTVYSDDPGAQALAWQQAGCQWVHVVDLNGAFAGRPVNQDAVVAILKAVAVPVQLGGGIRDLAGIERWLSAGIARVILGSAAVKTPSLVRDACRRFPGRIAVGIGAAAIIYTDIARDGMLGGVNIDATLDLASQVTTAVIASGGVGGPNDLRALRDRGDGVLDGVIVGRALYDGRLQPAEALAILASQDPS